MNQNIKIYDDKIKITPFMDHKTFKKLDIHYVYKKKRIRICQIRNEEIQKKYQIELKLQHTNLDK